MQISISSIDRWWMDPCLTLGRYAAGNEDRGTVTLTPKGEDGHTGVRNAWMPRDWYRRLDHTERLNYGHCPSISYRFG